MRDYLIQVFRLGGSVHYSAVSGGLTLNMTLFRRISYLIMAKSKTLHFIQFQFNNLFSPSLSNT